MATLDAYKATKNSAAAIKNSNDSTNAVRVFAKDFNALVDRMSIQVDANTTETAKMVLVRKGQTTRTASAINATATATAAQVATGYITSTSAAGTTITLPTGTLLGAELGATAGTVFDLVIDNTAGASTVTIAVATNGILSAAAAAVGASFGLLTVPAGVTGMAVFRLMFSSATAFCFTRVA